MRWADREAIGLFEEIKNGRNVTDNYGRLIWNYTNRGNSWRDREMVGLLEKIRNGTDVAANYGRAYWNYIHRGNSWGSRAIAAVLAELETASAVPPAPTNSVLPAISGNNYEGQTLTATTGTWTNSPTSYTYQWTADGTNIGGATSSTYVLATGQAEKVVRVVVTATNAGGSGNATSDPTATIMGNPITIFGAGLLAWYDPSDSSSVTQSGGLVSQLSDKSGNGYHMTAATTARPTYSATAIQGKPGLVFDGSANVMKATSVGVSTSTNSAFVMAEQDTGAAQFHTLFNYTANGDSGPSSANSANFFELNTGPNPSGYHSGGYLSDTSGIYASGGQPPLPKQLYRFLSVFDGANNTMYSDNQTGTPAAATFTWGATGTLSLCGRPDASQLWKGAVGEIVVLKRAPSSGERDKMQAWLVRSWVRVLVTDGDSLVHGGVSSTTPASDDGYVRRFSFLSNPSTFLDNISIGGSHLSSDTQPSAGITRANNGYTARIPANKYGKKYFFYANYSNNIGDVLGVNDVNNYCVALGEYMQARKAEGYDKVGTGTILSRTDAGQGNQPGQNNLRNAINAIITGNTWKTTYGVDFVADLSSDSIMGTDTTQADHPTYWQADLIHPTSLGHARLEPIFTAAVNAI